jgi:MFS family permease
MIGALTVAGLPPTVNRNRVVPVSLLAFGLLLFAFSLSRNLWVSSAISALAGAALMTTNSLANTSIQSAAPPQLRGRVMGLFVTAFMGFMPISGLVFGVVGQYLGPSNAVLVGSIPLIAWAGWLVVSGALVRGATPAAT